MRCCGAGHTQVKAEKHSTARLDDRCLPVSMCSRLLLLRCQNCLCWRDVVPGLAVHRTPYSWKQILTLLLLLPLPKYNFLSARGDGNEASFRTLQGGRDAAAKDRALLCRGHEAGGCGRKGVGRLPEGLRMLLLAEGVALRCCLLMKAPGLPKGVGGCLMAHLLSLTKGDAPVTLGLGPKPCARLGPKI